MFRAEVLSRRVDRLSGNVVIAVPVSWQSVGILIFSSVLAALLFLMFASYARVETVDGSITPDTGVAAIVPLRTGVITALHVHDGEEIAQGAALASIRTEEDATGALSPAALVEKAIERQDKSLLAQMLATQTVTKAQLAQFATQRVGLLAEITQLNAQLVLQRDLITSAQKDFERARIVADRGFISGRELQLREETLLGRQQGMAQLEQALAAKQASLKEIAHNAAQTAAQLEAQSASLAVTRAEVAQRAASAAGARSYALKAPVAGRVTALTARVGQAVNPQTELMAIVPTKAVLRAELAVPSSAIGFIKPGQTVRLAIDAFPYQRFGTLRGVVQSVAASPVRAQGPNGSTLAVYPITVTLEAVHIMAYGRSEPLLSGMTLTARIVTEKQSLLEWLFEPLFAVRQR